MASKAYEQGKATGYEQGHDTVTATAWDDYRKTVGDRPEHGWLAELAEFQRGVVDGAAARKAVRPYSVNFWGSDPDAGNDDCDTGIDFATRDEALAAFQDPWPHVNAAYFRPEDTAWFEVDGPDLYDKRPNPAYRPRRRDDGDDEWRREQAMQAGMGLGVDAYNDAMGYS